MPDKDFVEANVVDICFSDLLLSRQKWFAKHFKGFLIDIALKIMHSSTQEVYLFQDAVKDKG